MKKSNISIIFCTMLFIIMVAFVSGTPKTVSINENTVSGYSLYAKAGSANEMFYCGEDNIIVTVANSTDEIDTGTEIWIGHTMTIHYTDGIITSRSGPTDGLSFFIVDGIVGASAEPC